MAVELSGGEDSERTGFCAPEHLLHVYYGRRGGLCVVREPVFSSEAASEFERLSLSGQPGLGISETASMNSAASHRGSLGAWTC